MKIRAFSRIMLTLLLIGMLSLVFDIQQVRASGTVFIRADGSVEGTTHISSVDNVTYTFTDNIYDSIVVERDNIVVDGAGYTVQGAGSGNGIYLSYINNVTLKNVEVTNFDFGIRLDFSSDNSISGNTVSNNTYGIRLYSSSDNSISGNTVSNNTDGILLVSSNNDNVLSSNTVSSNSVYGILLSSSNNDNVLSSNTASNNHNGILLVSSCNNNVLSGNTASNNTVGIALSGSCNNNVLSGNTVSSNNVYGIRLVSSYNNTLFHNNFINNTEQVDIPASGYPNSWDDGYPSGGNYWSDYEQKYPDAQELDGSGIWDTSYFIDASNQDNYPLMEPWSPPTMIKTLIRTVKFWNLSKGTENSLTSKLGGALHFLDMEKENGAVHKLMTFINKVETSRLRKLTSNQADYLTTEAQRITNLING